MTRHLKHLIKAMQSPARATPASPVRRAGWRLAQAPRPQVEKDLVQRLRECGGL